MDFLKVLEERHSTRRFEAREVPHDSLQRILAAVRAAPSAGNQQSRFCFVVKRTEVRATLAEAALRQSHVAEAPVVLVFCADQQGAAKKYNTRGRELYSLQDATIAATIAWLTAVNEGLAGVWVGAFDEKRVAEALACPPGLRPVALLPIGYAREKPFITPRKEPLDVSIEV